MSDLQLERKLREDLQQERAAEMDRRTAEHQANVERFKQHKKFRALVGAEPLNIHAIGDSWFEYPLDGNTPVPFSNFAIVSDIQLGAKGSPRPNILNRGLHGQTSTEVLSWQNQTQMIYDWITPKNWTTGKVEAILVSMGGNDIAGDSLAIYLTYGGGVQTISKRFQGVLDLVAASYQDLFYIRDQFAPNVPIFGHCYDYALPNGIPAAGVFGPWLHPSFKFAHYQYSDAQQVVKDMIDKYYSMLNGLASDKTNNFFLIDTRGTIVSNNTDPHGWANELHPRTPGFSRLADRFLATLRVHFQGRI